MAHTSACPECGFDLEQGTACRVCGYQPEGSTTPTDVRSPQPRETNPHGVSPRGILFASAIGLVIVLAAFIVTNELMRTPQDNTDTSGHAILPAPTIPEPLPSRAETASPIERQKTEMASALPGIPGEQPEAPMGRAGVSTVLPSSQGPTIDITARNEHPPLSSRGSFVEWMLAHTDQKRKYLEARWDRARVILDRKLIQNQRILEGFLLTPRESFCRDPRRAYENAVLPIGYGQTISGPHLVARMTDSLNPQPQHRVLEIGTGSGYQSAFLSELSNHVYTIEIVEELARETDQIYRRMEGRYPEYRNITRKIDDGYYGWEEYAPFDRIIVTCGIDHIPPQLLTQLAPEGVMVIPIGPPSGQTILRIVKHVAPDGSVTLDRKDIYQGKAKQIFVPFTSRGGGMHKASDAADGE